LTAADVAASWNAIIHPPEGVTSARESFYPVLTREGGYAFDAWTPENGVSRGYVYRRIEDAYYARNFEIRACSNRTAAQTVACATVDEFVKSTI
jgi:hypothetical protein